MQSNSTNAKEAIRLKVCWSFEFLAITLIFLSIYRASKIKQNYKNILSLLLITLILLIILILMIVWGELIGHLTGFLFGNIFFCYYMSYVIGPSRVHALSLAEGRNVGGHSTWHYFLSTLSSGSLLILPEGIVIEF